MSKVTIDGVSFYTEDVKQVRKDVRPTIVVLDQGTNLQFRRSPEEITEAIYGTKETHLT